jgi:hypothetical protein
MKKHGPLSIATLAINYATGLYARVRCIAGWRKDAFGLLRAELDAFVSAATVQDFTVVSMWEYQQLVGVVSLFLSHKQSPPMSRWFHDKVCKDLYKIGRLLREVPFEEDEKESLQVVVASIKDALAHWVAEKARG